MDNKDYAKLFVGEDSWHTYGTDEVPSLTMSDGPHGLRIEVESGIGFNTAKPSIAYPTVSTIACSFDKDLLNRFGKVLAEECLQESIQILLGPGINHKRSPLCGRNFEYYSEDPILTSELANSFINGLQEAGVGACVKHYAANSREMGRLLQDSVVDKRALFELYLRQFERTVKKSKPYAIMAAYNKLNGTYCTENSYLLKDLLRDKWGYKGLVMSDWGAVSDPVQAFKNGLNLEMPGVDHGTSKRLLEALENNEISNKDLIDNAKYFKELNDKCKRIEGYTFSKEEHLAFAQEVVEKSAVLLKNEGCLPLDKNEQIGLIGLFAKQPRFEGAGSSKVNCENVQSLYDVLSEQGIPFEYGQGYHIAISESDPVLVENAKIIAKRNNKVVVVVGLPEGKEAEGLDRKDMDLPKCQVELIESLYRVNPNIIVLIQCGASITMPWVENTNAILLTYLSGAKGAKAQFNLIYGECNPSGKLAETFPIKLTDTPTYKYFHDSLLQVQYRESIFSGYRYYDTFKVPVRFPFGYGLSYTTFSYDDLEIEKEDEYINLKFNIKNTGKFNGREVYQIYVGLKDSKIVRPVIELKQFGVVELEVGEEKTIEERIEIEDLKYFDVDKDDWALEQGNYQIYVGTSSAHLDLMGQCFLEGELEPVSYIPKDYIQIKDDLPTVSDEDFEKVLGYPIPKEKESYPFTRDSSIYELGIVRKGRRIIKYIERHLNRNTYKDVSNSMVLESPIRMLLMYSTRFTWDTVDQVVRFMNGDRMALFRIRKTFQEKHT